ncbi:MAG: cation-efflux pump [Ignavibacteria bacterium CG_4_9_14_3_um_filter_36_18]|nr:cation transporter [Ignavibacteria bacterium]PJB01185.1 MAG: cation-efflux pump [Ignavibacteria bacterium CG_4_9_14_3_um_filter_36_18]
MMAINKIRVDEAKKVTWIGFGINIILTILKFFAGIFGNSAAMIADAVHSFSDFVTDLIVIFSFRIVNEPADETHDYGHGKFETLASLIVGGTLLLVGIGILWTGVDRIIEIIYGEVVPRPGFIALIAAAVSIVVKEILYQYQVVVGRKINSKAIIANAWHHRSDALSSVATLFGIGGAYFLGDRWRILDPAAAVLVSFAIMKIAYDIGWDSIKELLEFSLGSEEKEKIYNIIRSVNGVINPHNLRTRKVGNYPVIDIHIEVISSLTVEEAHNIVEEVELQLRKQYAEEAVIYVHVDPENQIDPED